MSKCKDQREARLQEKVSQTGFNPVYYAGESMEALNKSIEDDINNLRQVNENVTKGVGGKNV